MLLGSPSKRRIGEAPSLAEAAAASLFSEKKWIWLSDATHGYVRGWVSREWTETEAVALVPGGRKETDWTEAVIESSRETLLIPTNDVSRMNPPKFDRVDDIADLTFLNEASVVNNLRLRYLEQAIYTYSGLFLVAINPYRDLPLYSQELVQHYKRRRREDAPPHVYAVAQKAWQKMLSERECQSILITGESGAGKTENTKRVIQYLTAVASEAVADRAYSSSTSLTPARTEDNRLEQQILEANPILEAFGNAQTVRNNNSSRFGKFVRIEFDSAGAIAGANIEWYLLEKSRVTGRSRHERSFHIFYMLLKGASADLRSQLLLDGGAEKQEYLSKSQMTVDGINDAEAWKALLVALHTVGFSREEQLQLFKVVAAILHIGNIQVSTDRSDQALVRDNTSLEKACHLLGLPVEDFRRAVLTPKVRAGRDLVTQSRTKQQVTDELAALCKTIYEKAFGKMVDRINLALDRDVPKSAFIGVLDIAGFEIFEENGFEQLCINYTNEKLQQYFNHHMFVLEQEEYAREDIEWDFINFGLDLQPTIDLIESSQPIGVLSCLDEEAIMPGGSDKTFTEKLGVAARASSKFSGSRFADKFSVQHYAGKVEYTTSGWLEKNKDPINDNVTALLSQAADVFVRSLFAEFAEQTVAAPLVEGRDGPRRRVRRGAFRTVAQRHKEQLNVLMAQLRSTQPHFIRCIVPNTVKRSGQFEVPLVLDQLRCNGVLEGIRIARLGYPNRLPFIEFRQRYEILTRGVSSDGFVNGRLASQRMVESLELDPTTFRIGLTKVFFRAGVLASLEERRDTLLADTFSRLQATCRGIITRHATRKILHRANAVRVIQRNARVYLELQDWPWWDLYTRVRPLLAASRVDDNLRKREQELVRAKNEAVREKQERDKLEAVQATLRAERRQIEDALQAERALTLEKDTHLLRSKEKEAALYQSVTEMQKDIDYLESQLTVTLESLKTAEIKSDELESLHNSTQARMAQLEQEQVKWQQQADAMSNRAENTTEQWKALNVEKAALTAQLAQLEQQGREGAQDVVRARQRIKVLEAEAVAQQTDLALERESMKRRADMLIKEARYAKEQYTNATRKATGYEAQLQRKEQDLQALSAQLQQQQKDRDSLLSGRARLQAQFDAIARERQQQIDDYENLLVEKEKIEGDLEALRASIQTHTSETARLDVAAKAKEAELASLRADIAKLSGTLAQSRQETTEQSAKLLAEVATAKAEASARLQAHEQVTRQVNGATSKLQDAEAALSAAKAAQIAAENELASLRAIQQDAGRDLQALQKDHVSTKQQLSATLAQLRQTEEASIGLEREKTTLLRELKAFETRVAQNNEENVALRELCKRAETDAAALRQQVMAQTRQNSELQAQLATLSIEVKKAQSAQDKTVVEHVHVLEEAKRFTDRQLAETQARLEEASQHIRSLEKTKQRLAGEVEDLSRAFERGQPRRSDAGQPNPSSRHSLLQKLQSNNAEIAKEMASKLDRFDKPSSSASSAALALHKDVVDLKKQLEAREKELALHRSSQGGMIRDESQAMAKLDQQRRRLEEDLLAERERAQQELEERDFAMSAMRRKYQSEFDQLTEELQAQREHVEKERQENAELSRLNASLDAQTKTMKKRVLDMETRMMSASPRNGSSLSGDAETRIRELSTLLENERRAHSSGYGMNGADIERYKQRAEEKAAEKDRRIGELRKAVEELQQVEADLQLNARRTERKLQAERESSARLRAEMDKMRSRSEFSGSNVVNQL
ncbi:uncharacterized protein L969DRAFT_97785 [Mixia osmundae IAM 14324]|nr:uncharacterized protein L969DRAFT_97785 [Mixia osmundae IAM 14324]KEI42255.1 hypothetical protein L969DRAFT_97785 [Mixia osmundae IAM 14324]